MSFEWMLPVFLAVLASLLGAGIWVLKKTGWQQLSTRKKVVTLLGLVLGLGGFVTTGILYGRAGFEVDPMINAATAIETPILPIAAPSPA